MKLARNMHSLSHYRLATTDMGFLLPICILEVLPGDQFLHSTRLLMRVQPLLKPVMHPVDCRIHHWYVPNRLLWENWDSFITGADRELLVPTIDYESGVDDYTLLDHLGVPDANNTLNALPIRAYNAVYNHAYRDQDIHPEVDLDNLTLLRACWQKDYFTTARANPQLGAASITIPFSPGLTAPVVSTGAIPEMSQDGGGVTDSPLVSTTATSRIHTTSPFSGNPIWGAETGLAADLSSADGGGIDVNDLRRAIAQQKFLEHRNRFGTRHEDYLRFLGVRASDARLQNPEYLGGGKNVISFSEVLATADAGAASVGDLSGHGISGLSTRRYRRFFEESGFVISLLSVRPRAIYTQQLHRMWLRRSNFDYWQKELEAMGPQEIYTKELYGLHADGTTIFGYNGRHDEYRHHPSYVSGAFRQGGTEEDWHLGRDFDTSPALNASFLDCVPADRIYADTETPELYCNISHNIKAVRGVSARAKH